MEIAVHLSQGRSVASRQYRIVPRFRLDFASIFFICVLTPHEINCAPVGSSIFLQDQGLELVSKPAISTKKS